MRRTIERIDRLMASILSVEQAAELHAVLIACLVGEGENSHSCKTIGEYLDPFLAAKRLEGCSERSLRYYASTLTRFCDEVSKSAHDVTTDDIRDYLMCYSGDGKVGKPLSTTSDVSYRASFPGSRRRTTSTRAQ